MWYYVYKGILFNLQKAIRTHATTWMNLEDIILNEKNNHKKTNTV